LPRDGITPYEIQKDMRKAGYTDIATSLSLESLKRKGLIEYIEFESSNFGEYYTACILSSSGLDWMLQNQNRFKLSREREEEAPPIRDEDIPF